MTIQDTISGLFIPEFRKALTITKIQGDASSRQYFRVCSPEGSLVACHDPAFAGSDPETYPFLILETLLSRNNIPVPAVFGIDAQQGLMLLEDCGDLLLQDEMKCLNHEEKELRYRAVIDIMIAIQSIPPSEQPIPFSLSFDHDKLMMEFDFFILHALQGYFPGLLDDTSIDRLREEFQRICELIAKPEHFVLNHRDFHSRNILVRNEGPAIIDFQDARMGLPQYDAVSLLRDSYAELENTIVDNLKQYHFEQLRSHNLTTMGVEEYLYYFDLMAFQRNIKAIGTFSYQVTVAGNSAFEASIAPTVRYLSDYISRREELRSAGSLLQPIIRRFEA
jgi:hypothetical protein